MELDGHFQIPRGEGAKRVDYFLSSLTIPSDSKVSFWHQRDIANVYDYLNGYI